MELYVACSSPSLPDTNAIQRAAVAHGSELVVPAIDWQNQAGFLPMVIGGRASGAEVDVFRGDEAAETASSFGLANIKTVLALRWGGDLTEAACALSLAGAVAAECGGQICDPQEGVVVTVQQTFEDARSLLAESE